MFAPLVFYMFCFTITDRFMELPIFKISFLCFVDDIIFIIDYLFYIPVFVPGKGFVLFKSLFVIKNFFGFLSVFIVTLIPTHMCHIPLFYPPFHRTDFSPHSFPECL